MNIRSFARVAAVILAAASVLPAGAAEELTLLNVSYDPTRELWRDVNEHFIADYKAKTGVELTINQSHGGSSTQARAVIDGLEADVVSLASYIDTNAIAKRGLIKSPWVDRFPNHSLPYTSTIVFVVRKGNPWKIPDWPDLVKPGVEIVTPNPKTSGNGYLTFFSAWGSVVLRGGSEDQAKAFLAELYKHVPVLDSGARGATTTFVQKRIGDVHLAWENEARLEVQEAKGGSRNRLSADQHSRRTFRRDRRCYCRPCEGASRGSGGLSAVSVHRRRSEHHCGTLLSTEQRGYSASARGQLPENRTVPDHEDCTGLGRSTEALHRGWWLVRYLLQTGAVKSSSASGPDAPSRKSSDRKWPASIDGFCPGSLSRSDIRFSI